MYRLLSYCYLLSLLQLSQAAKRLQAVPRCCKTDSKAGPPSSSPPTSLATSVCQLGSPVLVGHKVPLLSTGCSRGRGRRHRQGHRQGGWGQRNSCKGEAGCGNKEGDQEPQEDFQGASHSCRAWLCTACHVSRPAQGSFLLPSFLPSSSHPLYLPSYFLPSLFLPSSSPSLLAVMQH